jgi:hypothetical protein
LWSVNGAKQYRYRLFANGLNACRGLLPLTIEQDDIVTNAGAEDFAEVLCCVLV